MYGEQDDFSKFEHSAKIPSATTTNPNKFKCHFHWVYFYDNAGANDIFMRSVVVYKNSCLFQYFYELHYASIDFFSETFGNVSTYGFYTLNF